MSPSNTVPALVLALLAAAPAAAEYAGKTAEQRYYDLRLRMVWKGGQLEVKTTNSGLGEAETKFKELFRTEADPTGYKSRKSWQVLQALSTLKYCMELVKASSLNDEPTLPIELHVQDAQTTDDGKGHWPHVARVDGRPTVRLGETGMTGTWDVGRIQGTLLHEFGHMADGSTCQSLGYGPDGDHYFEEIIAPSGAFTEGWAHYIALRGKKREDIPSQVHKDRLDTVTKPAIALKLETTKGKYVELAAADRTLWDYVANESFVAGVLLALRAEDGKDDILEAAMVLSTQKCRTLADFLRWYSFFRIMNRDKIKAILKKYAGNAGSEADYDELLSGGMGTGLERHTCPRPRSYTPPAPPAPADLACYPAEPEEQVCYPGDDLGFLGQ